jgi:hypothetical protein
MHDCLDGMQYTDFLDETLPLLLENVTIHLHESMWFQPESAPPHFACQVHNCLHNNFPERWNGCEGLNAWPSHAPNLTSLDIYLCGCMKEKVYATEVQDCNELLIALRWLLQTSYLDNQFLSVAQFDITVRHAFWRREDTLNTCCDRVQYIQCADKSPPNQQKSAQREVFRSDE